MLHCFLLVAAGWNKGIYLPDSDEEDTLTYPTSGAFLQRVAEGSAQDLRNTDGYWAVAAPWDVVLPSETLVSQAEQIERGHALMDGWGVCSEISVVVLRLDKSEVVETRRIYHTLGDADSSDMASVFAETPVDATEAVTDATTALAVELGSGDSMTAEAALDDAVALDAPSVEVRLFSVANPVHTAVYLASDGSGIDLVQAWVYEASRAWGGH